MRKSRFAILMLSVIVAVPLSLAACAPAAPAQAPSATTTPAPSQPSEVQDELASDRLRAQNPDYWQKIEDLLRQTLAGVSRVRGLPAPAEVKIKVVTVAWARQRWGVDYVKDSARKIQIDERIFKGLLLLPEDISLGDLYAAWPGDYLASALGNDVYFVQENILPLSGADIQKVLTHEVVHLLQDRFPAPDLPTYDADKAWAALVEGDADFTRAMYLQSIAGQKPPELPRLTLPTPSAAPALPRPPGLTNLLYFPYRYGQAFAGALYGQGSWDRVNQALQKPPASTHQVMHPESYLSGFSPREIPTPFSVPSKRTDRMGEYFIRVMLETWLTPPEAAAATLGWAGDRLDFYEDQRQSYFVWYTAWDSGVAATLFNEAFVRMLGKAGAIAADGQWTVRGRSYSLRKVGDTLVEVIVREPGLVGASP